MPGADTGLRVPSGNERSPDPGGDDPSDAPPVGQGRPTEGLPLLSISNTKPQITAPALSPAGVLARGWGGGLDRSGPTPPAPPAGPAGPPTGAFSHGPLAVPP